MVGGRVIETLLVACPERGSKLWVNCEGTGAEEGEECAIYVADDAVSRSIGEDDSFYWQGSWAYWTPAHVRERGDCWDYKIKRYGYSGVPRPEAELEVAHGF